MNGPSGPTGSHMIETFRTLASWSRSSKSKTQRELGDVYETAARCIENEARRADHAEFLLSVLAVCAEREIEALHVHADGLAWDLYQARGRV